MHALLPPQAEDASARSRPSAGPMREKPFYPRVRGVVLRGAQPLVSSRGKERDNDVVEVFIGCPIISPP